MRPLDPQDRDAPLSVFADPQGFWDHLGSARAEEYAQEEILPITAVPTPRAQDPEPASIAPSAVARDDIYTERLEDTLQPLDVAQVVLSAGNSTAASVSALATAQIPDAGFAMAADPAPRPDDHRRPRRTRLADGRLSYRLQRIWLTPLYRALLKFGLPAVAVLAGIAVYFSDEANRQTVLAAYDTAYSAFVDRPEFMVTTVRWPDVAPELDAALQDRLNLDLPQSSFRLDLDALRLEVEALDWVRSADLRLLSDGVLAVSLIERVPAILWRSESGLELLDDEGIRVALVTNRAVRSDLPLIAGAGAAEHIREALDLFEAATPLGPRVRGLVRVGERRWDVVLDRDQRIRLPETGALAALERVMALEQAQDLLTRDLLVADLRNPSRPVLQISPSAMETLKDIRSQSSEAR